MFLFSDYENSGCTLKTFEGRKVERWQTLTSHQLYKLQLIICNIYLLISTSAQHSWALWIFCPVFQKYLSERLLNKTKMFNSICTLLFYLSCWWRVIFHNVTFRGSISALTWIFCILEFWKLGWFSFLHDDKFWCNHPHFAQTLASLSFSLFLNFNRLLEVMSLEQRISSQEGFW